jgi:GWxTD domain-containing protein
MIARLARTGMLAATAAAAAATMLAGCGSWKRVGTEDRADASSQLTQLLDLPTYFRRVGRLAAGGALPFVGAIAFTAGAGDTVVTTLGLSLENRALNFQKEGAEFVARYHIDVSFVQPGRPPVGISRDEVVRVSTFQETQRGDESILFQQVFYLLPGTYRVTVALRDPATTNVSQAELDVAAPAFGPGSTTAPILVYQATGRERQGDPLKVVLNSRGVVGYGSDTLLAYVEGYRFPGAASVPFEVRTAEDSVIYRDSLHFRGGQPVESQVIRLAPDSVALGELKLVLGDSAAGTAPRTTSAVVSFSQAWVVTNYQEMLALLRYFPRQTRLEELERAEPAQRGQLWRQFWRETDPDPGTPENEALNAYFTRVQIANVRFRDEGGPGWRTDRGEVFISIGEPDETFDQSATNQGRVVRWTYLDHRINLYFVDESGFGRFRLTPSSRADFERALRRERMRESP